MNEGLRSRIYAQLTQQNSSKEWADEQNRRFSKEDIRWPINTWKDTQHHSLLEKCKQNHSEASPHTGQNGHHEKIYRQ